MAMCAKLFLINSDILNPKRKKVLEIKFLGKYFVSEITFSSTWHVYRKTKESFKTYQAACMFFHDRKETLIRDGFIIEDTKNCDFYGEVIKRFVPPVYQCLSGEKLRSRLDFCDTVGGFVEELSLIYITLQDKKVSSAFDADNNPYIIPAWARKEIESALLAFKPVVLECCIQKNYVLITDLTAFNYSYCEIGINERIALVRKNVRESGKIKVCKFSRVDIDTLNPANVAAGNKNNYLILKETKNGFPMPDHFGTKFAVSPLHYTLKMTAYLKIGYAKYLLGFMGKSKLLAVAEVHCTNDLRLKQEYVVNFTEFKNGECVNARLAEGSGNLLCNPNFKQGHLETLDQINECWSTYINTGSAVFLEHGFKK